MTCLIWRQHRWQLLWTGLFLAVLCGLAAWVGLRASQWVANYNAWLRAIRSAGCPLPGQRGSFTSCTRAATRSCNGTRTACRTPSPPRSTSRSPHSKRASRSLWPSSARWSALRSSPGRSSSGRNSSSWTQSASRRRWFVTKVVVIAAALAAAGLIAGIANGRLQHPLTQGGLTSSRWVWFYSSDLALAGEIVVAFALAVALGAWLRRTLPAVVAAWVAFLPVLFAVGLGGAELRSHGADDLSVAHRRPRWGLGGPGGQRDALSPGESVLAAAGRVPGHPARHRSSPPCGGLVRHSYPSRLMPPRAARARGNRGRKVEAPLAFAPGAPTEPFRLNRIS